MTTEQRPSMHHSLCYGPRCDGLVPPTDDDGNELVEPRAEIPCPCECHVDASGAPRPVVSLALLHDAGRVMSRLVEAWVGEGTGDEEELLSGYNAVMDRIVQAVGGPPRLPVVEAEAEEEDAEPSVFEWAKLAGVAFRGRFPAAPAESLFAACGSQYRSDRRSGIAWAEWLAGFYHGYYAPATSRSATTSEGGKSEVPLPVGWTRETYPRDFLLYFGVRCGYVELTEHGWHWWVYNHDPAGSGYAATEAEARQHVIAGATKEPEPRA